MKEFHVEILRKKKRNMVIISILFIWVLSLVITPLVLSSGSVRDLEGVSTIIDHGDKWEKMPMYPGLVMLVGDFLCHQRGSRSLVINDNQMPVCARCFSIYLAFLCGSFFTLFIPNEQSHKEYLLYTMPWRWRGKVKNYFGEQFYIFILIGLFLLPVVIDGGLQLITSYESTNIVRVMTGVPAGWLAGVLLGAVINT